MIEMQEPLVVPPARRRRWVIPVVVAIAAAVGIGAVVALANRDDTAAPAAATSAELADIGQACTTWMNDDARWGSTSAGWCQDMTGWMTQRMANGSMGTMMMWGDPDRMLSTCRAWSDANPSVHRPGEWCENMLVGMTPHMDGDWEHWVEWMNGRMMGG